ncbi:hypothetical protein Fcan01_10357 [Folsomia candida]|uniref:Gustatory receptor n=1 Tax=Folsomia candida TaxID=158441 RepID=A0A226E923_FOLCA|nr:hypothetical protein Fcan01_10357 [Folsomia candida]
MELLQKPVTTAFPLKRPRLRPPSHPSLTLQFTTFVKFLRVMGRCPLTIQPHSRQGRQVEYAFKWLNLPFLFSLSSALFISTICIVSLLQNGTMGFQLFSASEIFPHPRQLNDYPESIKILQNSPLTNTIVISFEVISIIHIIIDYVIAWVKAPDLAKWLNRWNSIEDEIEEWCGISNNKKKPSISKFQYNLSLYYVILPSLFFGTLIASWEFDLQYPIHCIVLMAYSYSGVICYGLEDTKAIIMFKWVEVGFETILVHLTSNPTTIINTSKLEHILTKIRSQAHHCGRYLAFQQLLLILVTIYFSASSLFAIVTILSGPVGDSRAEIMQAMMISFSATMNITKLYFKISVAVWISKMEKRVAVEIKMAELGNQLHNSLEQRVQVIQS